MSICTYRINNHFLFVAPATVSGISPTSSYASSITTSTTTPQYLPSITLEYLPSTIPTVGISSSPSIHSTLGIHRITIIALILTTCTISTALT